MAKIGTWLKKTKLDKIREWAASKENTIAIIAAKMKISPSTFYNWLNEYEEFRTAFDEGRRGVDEEVESSFFKMCTGFKETVLKPQKVKRAIYEDGKKVEEYEEFIDVHEEVYIKPDVTAQKFYLTNRQADVWHSDTKELGNNAESENTGVVMLPEIIEDEPVVEAEIIEQEGLKEVL